MIKWSKTKVFLIIFASLCILSLFFWRPVLTFAVKQGLERSFAALLDTDFSSKEIRMEGWSWIFEEPRLKGNKSLDEGGINLEADRLIVTIEPSLNPWNTWIEINIVNSTIHAKHASSDLSKLADAAGSPAALPFNSRIKINESRLTLYNYSGVIPRRETIYFDLNAESGINLLGKLRVSVDNPTFEQNCLSLDLSETEQHYISVVVDFDKVDCPRLLTAATSFLPQLQDFSILQGTIRGKIALTIPKEGRAFAQGDLHLNNLEFEAPLMELSGYIKDATLELLENPDKRTFKHLPRTIGHLKLEKGSRLTFERDKTHFCTIGDLGGEIFIQTEDSAKLSLSAICDHHGKRSPMSIEGEARFSSDKEGSLDFNVRLGNGNNAATARFLTRELGTKNKFAELGFKNIGPDEFDLLTSVLAPHIPESKQIEMVSGNIDASAIAHMNGFRITDLNIDNIAATNLEIDVVPWQFDIKIALLSGNLSVNLGSKNFQETINADLIVDQGQIRWGAMDSEILLLDDLKTKLIVRNGTILKSKVDGKLLGLRGHIDLDGTTGNEQIVKMRFTGDTTGIKTVLPEKMKEGVDKAFPNSRIDFSASARKKGEGFSLDGQIETSDSSINDKIKIPFGFDIISTSVPLWGKWPISHLAQEYWQTVGIEASMASGPALSAPSTLLITSWMRKEMGIAGLMIKNGWFKADNIDLKQYIEPFLFKEKEATISGRGDFEGNFDHTSLRVNYDLRQVHIENNELSIEVDRMVSSPQGSSRKSLPAVHYFDLTTGTSYGTLPLTEGTYIEKNSGLLFHDIHTLMIFNEKKLQLQDLQTMSNGLYFEGNILLDLSPPEKGVFDVDIFAHTLRGKFSNLKQLFSHFDNLKFFQKFPIESDLALRQDGAHLSMNFKPGSCKVSSKISGTLHDGKLLYEDADIIAEKITLSYDYDHDGHTFVIRDIEGEVFIGKGDAAEKYLLAGEEINFTNLEKNEAKFDLWLGASKRDIIRIAGKTGRAPVSPEDSELIAFNFDPALTHFGDVHPTKIDLILKDWSQIHQFKLDCLLSLKTILQDLQTLGRSGLIPLPESLKKKFDSITKAEGDFKISLNYDAKASSFSYHASGDKVALGDHTFTKCSLHGKKKHSTWAIDQLQLDNLSLAADLVRLNNSWKINFLGLRAGESLLLGMEGEYVDNAPIFEAKVNLLEINFAHLSEWKSLRDFVDEFNPKGHLRGSGQLRLTPSETSKWGINLDALINGSLRNWEFLGLPFEDTQNTSFQIQGDKDIALHQLKTVLKSPETLEPLAELHLEKLDYNFQKEDTKLENLNFAVPLTKMGITLAALQKTFPEAFTPKVTKIVGELKSSGTLSGTVSMHKSSTINEFKVALSDDTYQFIGEPHKIDNMLLTYNKNHLQVRTGYYRDHYHFWLVTESDGPEFNEGTLSLIDFIQDQNKSPLKLNWSHDPEDGFLIHDARGHFAGMDIDLRTHPNHPSTNKHIFLSGIIDLQPEETALLISPGLAQKAMEWKLKEGYRLNGLWTFGKKEKHHDGSPDLYFHGNLEGNDFKIKGYRLENMLSDLTISPGMIRLQNLKIQDPSIYVAIPSIDIYKTEHDSWYLSLPKLTAQNFRPSILREENVEVGGPLKPLLVTHFEIENLQGDLSDSALLTGKGKLQFTNPPKKNLQNTIFAIPGEILTRLGLNLTVLNPVSGTIFFDVNNGFFVVTKFKDVFSESKLSKFFLSHKSGPSYVDFDGNVHLLIRMRQYNLFFKLAELFTVSVGGTIEKPTYSLAKQAQTAQADGK